MIARTHISLRSFALRCGASRSLLALGAIVVAVSTGLTGCGHPAGVIFEPMENAPRWPAPPEQARIEYVGSLTLETDLKPRVSFAASLGRALFGGREIRTMLSPIDVSSDDAGRLFVCDSNAQSVHVFDLETREYARREPPESVGGFSQPVAITIDDQDRLLVADAVARIIDVFDTDGVYIGAWGDGQLTRPAGIAFDPIGRRIIVADSAAHQLVVFDLEGNVQNVIGQRGSQLGQFNFPTAVAVGPTGHIFVSDSLNFRIQVFDAAFRPIRSIGEKGDLPGYFGLPKGITVDANGLLFVVDAHFEVVQIFDSEGQLLLSFGREGQGPGEFWLPAGVHTDGTGRIWVADSYNRRVQVFRVVEEASP
jgi:DNA-binding beta-propeller fold protein YncE